MYTDGKWACEKMFNILSHYTVQLKPSGGILLIKVNNWKTGRIKYTLLVEYKTEPTTVRIWVWTFVFHMAQPFCISIIILEIWQYTKTFRAIFNSQTLRTNPSTSQMMTEYINRKLLSNKKEQTIYTQKTEESWTLTPSKRNQYKTNKHYIVPFVRNFYIPN